ncbi:RagB/SusD family nutrient uptake outer membrane protein [Sphingobacterium siyangense]|jgi:tetratricopeptide (TPR) repeat protein|uniref:RagB/SusD family nutrient uptake outer membrane protein n=1 Tax=Sphingobacterium siyangense TaxID=459529 RepID=UPI003DA4D611
MKNCILLIIGCTFFTLVSCKKYLDLKPDASIAVPETMEDIRGLLNDVSNLNVFASSLLENGTDDYYLDDNTLRNMNETDQGMYLWKKNYPAIDLSGDWYNGYRAVMTVNVALEAIDRIKTGAESEMKTMRGEALFTRALVHYCEAQVYTEIGQVGADAKPGIPIRLTSDYSVVSQRGTVDENVTAILKDLNEALDLLPETAVSKVKPTKAAAYALLSRIYLSFNQYELAEKYADEALKLYRKVTDLNTLNLISMSPFPINHDEIIYAVYGVTGNLLLQNSANVNRELYEQYADNDLRKSAYFYDKGNGHIGLKGNYPGTFSTLFFGLTTDEVLLISAECAARKGNLNKAAEQLNNLLTYKWKLGTYSPVTFSDKEAAIGQILNERRKELIFRGLRWSDIKRLNREQGREIVLKRKDDAGNIIAELPPNDSRYYYLIPDEVIRQTGMEQNIR